MNLIRRTNPTRELNEMTNLFDRFGSPDFDKVFNEMMSRWTGSTELTLADWTPAVDVEENNEAYTIKAEIPQVNKDDVKISIQNGVLTLTGERKQEKEEKGKRYHRIERHYGAFARSFTLPDNVDETKILASFGDGMLNIMLPKSNKPKTDVREIPVR